MASTSSRPLQSAGRPRGPSRRSARVGRNFLSRVRLTLLPPLTVTSVGTMAHHIRMSATDHAREICWRAELLIRLAAARREGTGAGPASADMEEIMKVADCMTRDVRIVDPDETLQAAARTMAEIDAGILPVGE